MYSFAAVGFIAIAAGAGFYMSQRATVARGEVMAETVHGLGAYGTLAITCDDTIPISVDGADFSCKGTDTDGAYELIACSLKPTGALACKTTEEHRARRTPKTGDAWK